MTTELMILFRKMQKTKAGKDASKHSFMIRQLKPVRLSIQKYEEEKKTWTWLVV